MGVEDVGSGQERHHYCTVCGEPAVAAVLTLMLEGYTTGCLEFSLSQTIMFSRDDSPDQPRTCAAHRHELIERLIKRVAPKPLRAFRLLAWSAELSDRSHYEGRIGPRR